MTSQTYFHGVSKEKVFESQVVINMNESNHVDISVYIRVYIYIYIYIFIMSVYINIFNINHHTAIKPIKPYEIPLSLVNSININHVYHGNHD